MLIRVKIDGLALKAILHIDQNGYLVHGVLNFLVNKQNLKNFKINILE